MVWAADVYWRGANTTVGAVTDTDVNSGALWSDAAVPDGSDTAWFDWTQTAAAQWTSLVIDGAFDPGSMALRADADAEPHVSTEVQLQLAKDLELETLNLIFGYQQSGGDDNLSVAGGKILSLTGSSPLSFGGHRGSWASIRLNSGATLRFPGAAHTFNAYNTNYAHNSNKAQGFRALTGLNGYVDFTGEGAAITLGDISGYSQRYPQPLVPPCIDLGYQALRVRSDQTWSNPSGTGLIRQSVARSELLPDAQHNRLVTSLSPDGLLPDLSDVPS